jgi:hypothetical protein
MATKVEELQARDAIVINVGARPVIYQRRVVRDRKTNQLVEIDIHELPPIDEGDDGVPYAFRQGEKVRSDHPAVGACPSAFVPAID